MSYKVCLDRYKEFCAKRGCPFFEESCPFLETPDTCPYAYVIEEDERGVQIQGEQIRVIGVDMGAGADQTGGISNGEYLRRVLPGMTDETLRNIFACKATCSDCPMEEPCRNCIDKLHRGEKAPDLTCGDRWELWLKEAVK